MPVKRYWNGFGLAIRQHGAQIIVVEINPPVRGYTAQVSGLFAKDNETGAYLLLHRGRIGGGRKGIGKNAFADWFRGKWVEVAASDSRVDLAILVARLESPNIAHQILAFVNEVALFKEEATSGHLTRKPHVSSRHKIFNPDFHGRKKGYRPGALDYETFHGLVVNKLAEKVRVNGVRLRYFVIFVLRPSTMGAGAIVIKYYLLPSGRGGVGPKKQFEMTGDLGKIAHQ